MFKYMYFKCYKDTLFERNVINSWGILITADLNKLCKQILKNKPNQSSPLFIYLLNLKRSMLKNKLTKKATSAVATNKIVQLNTNNNCMISKTSHLFTTTLWQNVLNLECQLNEKLRLLKPDSQITHIYNPLEYAAQLHCDYLRKFLKGRKKLLFIGMNPGHDGMGQTGKQEHFVEVCIFSNNFNKNICVKMSVQINITAFWNQYYTLEVELNKKLECYQRTPEVTYIYNPIEYASHIHCKFLQKYLHGRKKLLFFGLNPGPHGMVQTGVPFGNISTVKHTMRLCGAVDEPPIIHPKRPVKGLESIREEPSGKRLWTLFQKLSNDSLATFFEQCFVHNFCPLAFFSSNGSNITPNELKGPYKQQIRDECLKTTEQILELIQPEIIVAVGCYVFDTLKKSDYCKYKRLLLLPHPSPRSVNNTNWPEKAENFLIKEDLIKYLRNERSTI